MKNRQKSLAFYLAGIALAVILLWLDQWTKQLAVNHLKGQADIELISGVLKLHYLENHGAAFGILQNQQWFFVLMTLVILAVLLYVVIRMPKIAHYLPAFLLAFALIAGALGNFYDRLVQKYVVDFIYFCLIDFPIFNLADIYVTCSLIIFLFFFFFLYKEEDFQFLGRKEADK
ncbi:signal peptidase II [Lacrimispora saccharolytica]|nr:signal peptidase II [Lachnospiraceae bacterium]MDM8247897.1 signal peptidase II [Lacrimispora saccharolytica]